MGILPSVILYGDAAERGVIDFTAARATAQIAILYLLLFPKYFAHILEISDYFTA